MLAYFLTNQKSRPKYKFRRNQDITFFLCVCLPDVIIADVCAFLLYIKLTINSLPLPSGQIPASVDRAVAMATVTGGPGLPVSLTEDYESKHALGVAQATVVSLRERLAQKEETLGR